MRSSPADGMAGTDGQCEPQRFTDSTPRPGETYDCPVGIPPEKAMATHSSNLVWKIPWTEEAGGLQSMESLRVGHD